MAWTPPKTWAVGELLTASNFNIHIRDNLNALFLTNWAQHINGGTFTNAVAGWVQLAIASMTTIGRRVLMLFSATMDTDIYVPTSGTTSYFMFALDGGLVGLQYYLNNASAQAVGVAAVVAPSAAAHNFQMFWHAGTAALVRATGFYLIAIENV